MVAALVWSTTSLPSDANVISLIQLFDSLSTLKRTFAVIIVANVHSVRRRGRPRTTWIDSIKKWTGLSVEESVRMSENRDKWRKYVHGVANPRIEDG